MMWIRDVPRRVAFVSHSVRRGCFGIPGGAFGVGAPAALLALLIAGCTAQPRWNGPSVAPNVNGRFQTAEPFDRGLADLLRYLWQRQPGEWPGMTGLPRVTEPMGRYAGPGWRVTVVGHATALIETGGTAVLTDPVWSDRIGPVPALGLRRHAAPGVRFEALPPISAVLISHNHYDHLDLPTLKRLQAAHDPVFIVGLGDGALLRDAGLRRVRELDWWQSVELAPGQRLISVPVQHWSQRRVWPSDRNLSLWQGFVHEGPAGRVYFAGDTGYGPHFREAAERLGPMSLALLPIGAYQPRWLTAYQHMDPAEAVQAHRDLGAGQSFGIHWGTFELADEGQWTPPRDLAAAVASAGLDQSAFSAPAFGHVKLVMPPVPTTGSP